MSNRIYRYKTDSNPEFPVTSTDEVILDLGVIEGYRYVSASESITFSGNFKHLNFTGKKGTALKMLIRKQSPVCQQINDQTQRLIRESYSLSDELKALRTNDKAYHSLIETILTQGKQKKVTLGL